MAPTSATADDGECDPDNGKYICDGTDGQPEGSKPKKKRPKGEGKCDPAKGKYICDGTDDQPEGNRTGARKRIPRPPATGVSLPQEASSEDDVAMYGDDGVSTSISEAYPVPLEVQSILDERSRSLLIQPMGTPESSYLPRNHQA